MRIAYVTESFPPDLNAVASTAMRVTGQVARRGQEPLVIAARRASLLRVRRGERAARDSLKQAVNISRSDRRSVAVGVTTAKRDRD